MKWLLLLLLVGCEARLVESDKVIVDTRGVPIVRMVAEGAGGDLVPLTYTRQDETGVFLTSPALLSFLIGIGIGVYVMHRRRNQ
jgi:hypothetical protein